MKHYPNAYTKHTHTRKHKPNENRFLNQNFDFASSIPSFFHLISQCYGFEMPLEFAFCRYDEYRFGKCKAAHQTQ